MVGFIYCVHYFSQLLNAGVMFSRSSAHLGNCDSAKKINSVYQIFAMAFYFQEIQ